MYLKSAHIRHYKSIDNASVDFSGPVTVLVGPNAVGKSNIVDCLRFVRDAVTSDLEHAVSSRGGIARVRQHSRTKPFKLGVTLKFGQPLVGHADQLATYEFAIESQSASNYAVDFERASLFARMEDDGALAKRYFRRDRSGKVDTGESNAGYRVAPDQLAMGLSSVRLSASTWPIARFIGEWRYAEIDPKRLREPNSPDKDKALSEDGQNWASVIKALRRTVRGKEMLERAFDAMKTVIPSFEDVSVTTVGSYLVPRFRFSSAARDKVEFDPVQLSDGTLRIFGILLALYQHPSPRLLVIEEPERAVHPGVLGVLADAFREAAERTQIILTTHSPHFVDHFEPEQVRVVTLDEAGLTNVSAVKSTQLEAVKQKLMSMQDFMLAEGLLPEPT